MMMGKHMKAAKNGWLVDGSSSMRAVRGEGEGCLTVEGKTGTWEGGRLKSMATVILRINRSIWAIIVVR